MLHSLDKPSGRRKGTPGETAARSKCYGIAICTFLGTRFSSVSLARAERSAGAAPPLGLSRLPAGDVVVRVVGGGQDVVGHGLVRGRANAGDGEARREEYAIKHPLRAACAAEAVKGATYAAAATGTLLALGALMALGNKSSDTDETDDTIESDAEDILDDEEE